MNHVLVFPFTLVFANICCCLFLSSDVFCISLKMSHCEQFFMFIGHVYFIFENWQTDSISMRVLVS